MHQNRNADVDYLKWFLPHGYNPIFLLKFSSGCLPILQEENTINAEKL